MNGNEKGEKQRWLRTVYFIAIDKFLFYFVCMHIVFIYYALVWWYRERVFTIFWSHCNSKKGREERERETRKNDIMTWYDSIRSSHFFQTVLFTSFEAITFLLWSFFLPFKTILVSLDLFFVLFVSFHWRR